MRYGVAAFPALAALAALAPPAAFAQKTGAQTYPERSIRLVVGFPPGGSGDFIARNMAEEMNRMLNQQIIVDNRPGAGANIASEIVARANPDGYTILLGGSFSHAVNPALYRKLAFDVEKDFAPITKVANFTTIIAVNPKVAANTLKELIALAKAQPGKLTYSSPGAGTPSHMAGAMLNVTAGIDIVHVPFKGGAPQLMATLAGDVPVMIGTPPVALPQIRAGRLRALSLTSSKSSAVIPGIPGAEEAGLPGYDVGGWWGLWAPAHTPSAVISRVFDIARKVLGNPQIKERLAREGLEVETSASPQEFAAFIHAEIPFWAKVVRASGATAD
jgi:tripartite-type tricarboxylate transporter receptor subunit TctC